MWVVGAKRKRGGRPREICKSMAGRINRGLEHRVHRFYAVCEKILLRTLIFACFVYELGRFAKWLWR
jgi:hypothetical protein